MSGFDLIRWAREAPRGTDLSPGARHLLVTLALYAYPGTTCYPSDRDLADAMGLGDERARITLWRRRRELESAGLIDYRPGNGRGVHTVYVLNVSVIHNRFTGETRTHVSVSKCPHNRFTGETQTVSPVKRGSTLGSTSIEEPRVTIANGFAVDNDEPPADLDYVGEVLRAVRERRFSDIPPEDRQLRHGDP